MHQVSMGCIAAKSKRRNNTKSLERVGFRGDTRWAGIDLLRGERVEEEAIVGITETANLYLLGQPQYLGSAQALAATVTAGAGAADTKGAEDRLASEENGKQKQVGRLQVGKQMASSKNPVA